MISIRGLYDGKNVVPLEDIKVKHSTKVIITFLEKENESVSDRTNELLRLSGTWIDERSSDEIIQDIYDNRSISKKNVEL